MIPTKPPPTFRDASKWSPNFIEFVGRCLVKTPEKRATAAELLQCEFISTAGPCTHLLDMIVEAAELREKVGPGGIFGRESSGSTIVPGDQGTLVSLPGGDQGTFVNHSTGPGSSTDNGTMINYSDGTMLQHDTGGPGTAQSKTLPEIESNLGTMVINESSENTMKQYGTAPGQGSYRPDFMEHFEAKAPATSSSTPASISTELVARDTPDTGVRQEVVNSPEQEAAELEQNLAEQMELQRQLQQIAGHNMSSTPPGQGSGGPGQEQARFQRNITEGDFEFLKFLSHDDLTSRMSGLDSEMEKEIDDLRRRYHAKRQPILDAMDQKRKRQQNF